MSGNVSIAGVTPARTLVPADRVQLAATVRELYAAGKSFAFVGGGTELELGNPPRPLEAVVRTTALDRVVEYSPEDQTITVEAGMRLAALDAVLAQHDQLLPLEAGDRKNATVGGAIATNAFGAQRHRYGSIKDLIVGIEIVRADGVIARSGGKVVKNVAGFDLPKLMVGSLGDARRHRRGNVPRVSETGGYACRARAHGPGRRLLCSGNGGCIARTGRRCILSGR